MPVCPRNRSRILGSLLLVSLLAATACNTLGSGPEATIAKFHTRVEQGQIEGAIELLAHNCRSLGEGKWRRVLEEKSSELAERGGIKKLETQADEIRGGKSEASDAQADSGKSKDEVQRSVRVRTTITYGNGETDSEWVTLVEEEDGWKVSCTGK